MGSQGSKSQKRQGEYSRQQLERDLQRVRTVFDEVASKRARSAIYEYWYAVYKLSRKWRRLGKKGMNLKKLAKPLIQGGMPPSSSADPIRFIINATSIGNNQTAAERTRLSKLRSKYSSMLNYAYKYGVNTRNIKEFIAGRGGLNPRSQISLSHPRGGPNRRKANSAV
jgi:hypothetical protein